MEFRKLGSSGLAISPLTLGGNVFGWTADKPTSFALLDAFVDRGFNAVDTADVYSIFGGTAPGASESMIGEWLALAPGRRDKLMITTKFGLEMGPGLKGLSAEYAQKAVDASLRRLQTDHIDLYLVHFDDGQTPYEETLGAFAKMIEAGKVRAIGASNYSPERLAGALETSKREGLPAFQSLQPLYNLYDRSAFEGPLQQICRDAKLSVFPYFSLASGFLTGKYRTKADLDGVTRAGLVERYLDDRGMRILAAMDAIAADRSITLAQIAIAWLLAQPDVTSPIVSATSTSQLAKTLDAVSVTLSADELASLDLAAAY